MLLVPTLLCPKPWESMAGDETSRFCSYCKKHVHNLEALSVTERLALLQSPAASICSRYRAAVRRPVKGREESYYRHLAKYGAAVALTGSVLVVLWEMEGRAEKDRFYRAAEQGGRILCEMPPEWYREYHVILLGDVAIPPDVDSSAQSDVLEPDVVPTHVDLKLDPAEMQRVTKEAAETQSDRASEVRVQGPRPEVWR